MKSHYEKPKIYFELYGETYHCDHPLYNRCTLYTIGNRGLAVIQQRFDSSTKHTYWDRIDPWLTDDIYLQPKFKEYLISHGGKCENGLYPTVSVRQIMWALRMKPLVKERWETVFDRKII